MKVLAFDPGYERLGVAVIDKKNGKETLVHSDCLRTHKSRRFEERLCELGDAVVKLIKKHKPDCVALEGLYFETNAKTAMSVAAVRGMLAYVAAVHKLPVHEYTPLQVKVAITGYGKSDKAAISLMLPKLITLPRGERLDDELDAIAVGITCLASIRSY